MPVVKTDFVYNFSQWKKVTNTFASAKSILGSIFIQQRFSRWRFVDLSFACQRKSNRLHSKETFCLATSPQEL